MQRTLDLIRAGMEQGFHVGAQLYASLRGQTVFDEGLGLARPATGDRPALPMTRDTITLWLSAGKPCTAVALARLWERGLLDLDDPVIKFIPEFAPYGKDAITLRHILTHTAPLRLADTGWPDATWEQMIQRINVTRPEPRWESGRTAGYSAHVTWYVLAEIVRRLTHLPIAQSLRELVFTPCGIESTFVSMTPHEQANHADRIAFMQAIGTEGQPRDYNTDTPQALASPRPSGSIRGPIRELGRFYEMMLARGQSPLTQERVLLTQTVEAMTARHRVNTPDKTFGAIIDWGLGFMINSAIYGNDDAPYQFGPHASPRTFGHSGNQSSVGLADPERQLVVALMFNGMPGEVKHQQRMRAALTAIYEDLNLVRSSSS